MILVAVFGFLDRRKTVVPVSSSSASRVGARRAAGAASIADHSDTWWPGLIVGAAAALLGFAATRSLLQRVRARLDEQTAGALPLYAEAGGCGAAGSRSCCRRWRS